MFVIRDNLTLNIWTLLAPKLRSRLGRRGGEGTFSSAGTLIGLLGLGGNACDTVLVFLFAAAGIPHIPRTPANYWAASTFMT